MTRPLSNEGMQRFERALVHCPRERRLAPARGVPESMWEEEPDARGWVRWRCIPSTIGEEQLQALERELGQEFPPPYRRLLARVHFGVIDLGIGLRIRPHLPERWRRELLALREVMQGMPGAGRAGDLIPFATNLRPENGVVCFDVGRRADNGDCPVVLLTEGGSLRGVRRWTLFASSNAMFDRLAYLLEQDWRPPVSSGEAGGALSLRAEIKAAAEHYLGTDDQIAARAAVLALPAARKLFRLRGISLAKTGSA